MSQESKSSLESAVHESKSSPKSLFMRLKCDSSPSRRLEFPSLLNASMFTQIIRDPASSTEEESIRVFYESLQIAFPNNLLVSQFRG